MGDALRSPAYEPDLNNLIDREGMFDIAGFKDMSEEDKISMLAGTYGLDKKVLNEALRKIDPLEAYIFENRTTETIAPLGLAIAFYCKVRAYHSNGIRINYNAFLGEIPEFYKLERTKVRLRFAYEVTMAM